MASKEAWIEVSRSSDDASGAESAAAAAHGAADGATMKRMRYEARTAAGALNSHAAMCLVS